MKTIFVVLLTLLLCLPVLSQKGEPSFYDTRHVADAGEFYTVLDYAVKGEDLALLVVVSGEVSTAKRVTYGDKQLFELANELSVTGIGHTAIYGLPLGTGSTVADVVVEMTGEGNKVVTVIPCTGVAQSVPFEKVKTKQGTGKASLKVKGGWILGVLTVASNTGAMLAAHDWDSIRGGLHSMGRYGRDKVSFGSVPDHWTMAAVAVRESKER